MNLLRRDFVWLAVLMATAAIPALGQNAVPELAPSTSGKAAAIPDFSGIWAHLTFPGVEQPIWGPGPVKNLTLNNGIPDVYKLVGDYNNPILKPQAAAAVRQKGELESTSGPAPTPNNQCWPGGMPFVIFANVGMQMFQQPNHITIIYTNDHEVRRVRMNQPHPERVSPSWYGDSIGRYEGDTLVIDTVGVKIGPFAMLDMYGTPHSPALHVVERYRLLDYEADGGVCSSFYEGPAVAGDPVARPGQPALAPFFRCFRLPRSMPLAAAVVDYQKHRVKKLKKQGRP
jgi:hypothetical protein